MSRRIRCSLLGTLAVAGDDDSQGALLWDCHTGNRLQTLATAGNTGPVLDVCPFNGGDRVALLTERQVNVFQWASGAH